MALYILRWNPNISSYTKKDHKEVMEHLAKVEYPADFNWSVHDWKNLKKGDDFVLLQVGTENDGIAMAGTFTSAPYEAESWRNDGTKVHYADMKISCAFDCDLQNVIPAESLEKEFPKIKWHGGHSGEKASEEVEEYLRSEILLALKNSFLQNGTEANLFPLVDVLSRALVYVPMNTIMDEKDEAQLLEGIENGSIKEGSSWKPQNNIRMRPDILKTEDGKHFYPVFSCKKEIPDDYAEHFSMFPLLMSECIKAAKSMETVEALVMDAFTNPLFVDFDLADIILKMAEKAE